MEMGWHLGCVDETQIGQDNSRQDTELISHSLHIVTSKVPTFFELLKLVQVRVFHSFHSVVDDILYSQRSLYRSFQHTGGTRGTGGYR